MPLRPPPRGHRLLPVLGILLAGCLAITDVDHGILTVNVRDASGHVVPGARVEPIGGWYWSSPRAIELTDASGTARFRLPPAHYRVDLYPPDGSALQPFFMSDTATVGGAEAAITFVYHNSLPPAAAPRAVNGGTEPRVYEPSERRR